MEECAEGIAQSAKRKAHRTEVKGQSEQGRLASVIQAFGGDSRLDHPRLPMWREMDCLAFLSVVHRSRGIFFYTYGVVGKTEAGREALGRVVGRLNRVYPWLVAENSNEEVQVEMVSVNRFDPKGRPAVQCCLKRKGDEWLLIAVNTIGTYVEAELCAERMAQSAKRRADRVRGRTSADSADVCRLGKRNGEKVVREVFSAEDYGVKDGKIRVRFGPYEAKAFLFRRAHGAEGRARSG